MKVICKFKDPDTMQDACRDAAKALPKPDGVSNAEWQEIQEERADAAAELIAERWMEYGEYLDVEFDTEALTATILPRGTIK